MKNCATLWGAVAPLILSGVLVLATNARAQSSAASGAELSFIAPPVTPEDAVLLPNPRGPYQVGTLSYHWVLEDLEELTSSPWDRREVVAQLFYPAQRTRADVPPSAYVPELPLLQRGLLTHGFPPFAELSERLSGYARVQTSSWAGEPLLTAEGPFPVVLISPGGNMSRHWHTSLSQAMASQGYVVAVISHAHSGLDVFPGGGFLASNLYWHPGDDVPASEVERRDSLLASRLARDVEVVLAGLAQLAASDTVHGLKGGLDLERVAIIGHSRGGSTVAAACQGDLSIDTCIIFDNLGEVSGSNGSLHQPRLTVRATWSSARTQRLAAVLAGNHGDAFEAVIEGADHHSFTDLPFVDPGAYPSRGINPAEAHDLIARITLAFLQTYLLEQGPGFLSATATLEDRVEVRRF